MKVKELIKRLKNVDQEAEVIVAIYNGSTEIYVPAGIKFNEAGSKMEPWLKHGISTKVSSMISANGHVKKSVVAVADEDDIRE